MADILLSDIGNTSLSNLLGDADFDTTIKKIVIDYYLDASGNKTTEKTYYVDGKNVISGISGFDASKNQDGGIMCYAVTEADSKIVVYMLSSKDIFANENCTYMFAGYARANEILFNNFNTSRVETMNGMFFRSSFDSLNLAGFDTSNVTNMGMMFRGCISLERIVLSGWSTSNVTVMGNMFYGCSLLQQLDLSDFNTLKVTEMSSMFQGCESLQSLDLSSFDASSVTYMSSMFYDCSSLTTVYVSDKWTTSGAFSTWGMFKGCSALVGGNGTAYNSSYVDGTYARIDTADNPGYFTYKAAPAESASEGQGNENVVIAFGSGAVAIFGVVAFVWFYRKKKTGRFVGRMNK